MNFGYEAEQIYNEILKRGSEYSNDHLGSLFKCFWEYRDNFTIATSNENTSLKLEVEALKKENEIIWKSSIEKITAEKLKVRDLEERYRIVLGDK